MHLRDHLGVSPLLVACKFGQVAAVAALLSAGADYDQPSDSGLSPLNAALQAGHGAVVHALFGGAKMRQESAEAEMRQRECDVDALNLQITQRKPWSLSPAAAAAAAASSGRPLSYSLFFALFNEWTNQIESTALATTGAEEMLALRHELQAKQEEATFLAEELVTKGERLEALERAVTNVAHLVIPLQKQQPQSVAGTAAATAGKPLPPLPAGPAPTTARAGGAKGGPVRSPPRPPSPPPFTASLLQDLQAGARATEG